MICGVQSKFRAGADQDSELSHAEAAERLAKKRVAFKDIDHPRPAAGTGEGGGGVSPRRSYSASPTSQDTRPTPHAGVTGTRIPPPPAPRPNRFGPPRGRPGTAGIGGVPARRPMYC